MLTQLGHLTNDKRKKKRGHGEDESGSLAINNIVTLVINVTAAMQPVSGGHACALKATWIGHF